VARAAAAAKLVVVDMITEHDVEPDKKFAGERDFCLGSAASMQDGEVATSKIIIGASREGRGLTEDPAEECAALLGDLAEMMFVGRRVNGRRQADVAHDMFAVWEARDRPEDKDRGECGERTDAGMRQQEPSPRVSIRTGGDAIVQVVDPGGQPGEQLKAVVAAPCDVRGEGQGLQLGKPALGPQSRAERQALIQRDRLQAVFDHRPHPDEPNAVSNESPKVTRGRIRDPDGREAIVPEEVEEVPSVAPIRLRLTDDHGSDLRRFADEDSMTEPVHQSMKPLGVTGGLNPDRHRRAQGAVEALDGVALVDELLFENFAGSRVEGCDLLLARVQITSNECHESGLLFEGRVTVPQPNPINSGRPFS
jgi:hypothetical protein